MGPMINFTCYWCNKAFTAPDNLAGKAVKCKWCGQKVKLPQTAAPQSAAPQAAAPPPAQAPADAGFGGDPFTNLETPSAGEGYGRRRTGLSLVGMLIGLLGTSLIGIGLILPAMTLPNQNKLTYWQLGTGIISAADLKNENFDPEKYKITDKVLSIDGAVIAMLLLGALLFSLVRAAGMLYLISVGVLGCLGYTFGRIQVYLFQMKDGSAPPAGNFCIDLPYSMLPQAKIQPIGWAVLVSGAVVLFLAGILMSLGSRRRRSSY
jgi:hypothetical protein